MVFGEAGEDVGFVGVNGMEGRMEYLYMLYILCFRCGEEEGLILRCEACSFLCIQKKMEG